MIKRTEWLKGLLYGESECEKLGYEVARHNHIVAFYPNKLEFYIGYTDYFNNLHQRRMKEYKND